MILVTGGAGFIGSHVCLALLQAGHKVLVLDDFSNSHPQMLARAARLARAPLPWVTGDVGNPALLAQVLAQHPVQAVVHLAGLKSVADSVADPAGYDTHNAGNTRTLIAACAQAGVRRIVFSSSATVYGEQAVSPIPETAPCAPANPYGRSKWLAEEALRAAAAPGGWAIAALRYFNAAGAHESGEMGEAPRLAPSNLFAVLAEAAAQPAPAFQVYGLDWPTRDGSCERDYLHVQDLARAHVRALAWLSHQAGFSAFNLGSGTGHTVLEVHRAFEAASGRRIALVPAPRRAGDIARYFADAGRARRELDWSARTGLAQMAQDAWRWRLAGGAVR